MSVWLDKNSRWVYITHSTGLLYNILYINSEGVDKRRPPMYITKVDWYGVWRVQKRPPWQTKQYWLTYKSSNEVEWTTTHQLSDTPMRGVLRTVILQLVSGPASVLRRGSQPSGLAHGWQGWVASHDNRGTIYKAQGREKLETPWVSQNRPPLTLCGVRLSVRTWPFQGQKAGSIPARRTSRQLRRVAWR